MAYTIRKIAEISGISIRTLRFYDEIGLLKPAYYGDNNYRYYEDEQLITLQQILFYRELCISLKDIQSIMNNNEFNQMAILTHYKRVLKQKFMQTRKLIKAINKKIVYPKEKLKTIHEQTCNDFAYKFAFDSFVTAFEPGNEHMLDQYFAPNLVMHNHAMSKQLSLHDLKSRLSNIYNVFENLESKIKDVMIDGDLIAFRAEQKAIFFKYNCHGVRVKLDVMNLYKLANGKVKEWQIWVSIKNN